RPAFIMHTDFVESWESVALRYEVPYWSDKHFELLGKSFELMGNAANKTVYMHAINKSNHGNSETMVRWIKDGKAGRLLWRWCRLWFNALVACDDFEKEVSMPEVDIPTEVSIPAQKMPAKTSGLAVWSLVLGIAGVVCLGPLGGIPALILGIVGLNKIRSSNGLMTGEGLAIGGIVTGGISFITVAVLAIMAGMLLPALARAREEARKAVCKGNLRQIGMSASMYAQDNNKFPEKLSQLYPEFAPDLNTFACPSSDKTITSADQIDSESPYVLASGVTMLSGGSGALAYEKKGIHDGGANVVFVDGHVEWVSEGRLDQLLANPSAAP
ncbi:DUF4190 domain-containing protein, partial [Planctomycetota bacterium]